MEFDDPAVAAMHLAYAASFDPSVYVRRKRRRSARARAASAEASAGGADAAADGVPPAVVDAHHLAAKLTAVQELRGVRLALDTADLGPPDLQRAPPSWGDNADEVRRWGEDPRRVMNIAPRLSAVNVDWWRGEHIMDLDVPSWRMWVNRCLAGRCHSRTAALLASGTVLALHKDDPAAREERGKSGEPLRVTPLGVGSVLVRLASAQALGQVGADAREVMGPVQRSFQSGAGCETAYMSMRVALQLSAGVVLTGFLSRMTPPSELGPFFEAVDAANISASFSLLGMEACDQSTPPMEAAIVQMNMPADFGGMNLALLQYEAPAAFYSALSVVLPKMVREYGPTLGPLYEAVRAEVSSVATSALP
eukprot:jgi/Tetstr1/463669/TSEL_008530.t1